jgi:hypothetical protein
MNRSILCFCLALLANAGCKKSTPTGAGSDAKPLAIEHHARINACSLLTKEEVGQMQNTHISDAKGSENADGGFLVSQCYYAAAAPNASVSLALTQADPDKATAPDPRDYWRQIFSRFSEENAEAHEKETNKKEQENDKEKKESLLKQASRGEEEEKATPPKKISGIGDEAYWSGNRVGGALYVLKGDVFIRISVGGPDNEENKINKSKALALKTLGHL